VITFSLGVFSLGPENRLIQDGSIPESANAQAQALPKATQSACLQKKFIRLESK
jgi:hypothetical protein